MCLRHLPKRVAVRKVAQIGLASIALRKMAFVAWIVVAFFGSLRRLHLHHDGGDVLPLQRLHDGLGRSLGCFDGNGFLFRLQDVVEGRRRDRFARTVRRVDGVDDVGLLRLADLGEQLYVVVGFGLLGFDGFSRRNGFLGLSGRYRFSRCGGECWLGGFVLLDLHQLVVEYLDEFRDAHRHVGRGYIEVHVDASLAQELLLTNVGYLGRVARRGVFGLELKLFLLHAALRNGGLEPQVHLVDSQIRHGHDAEQRQFDIVKTYQSAWVKDADMVLTIDGSTMDAVFSSFVHQIAEGQLNANTKDLHTAVMENKEREQLQKNINILEQQMLKEKQPRKRFEIHQKLVKLKAKLNQ